MTHRVRSCLRPLKWFPYQQPHCFPISSSTTAALLCRGPFGPCHSMPLPQQTLVALVALVTGYVRDPAAGFFVGGSSLRNMNGVYARKTPEDKPTPGHEDPQLVYENEDTGWVGVVLRDTMRACMMDDVAERGAAWYDACWCLLTRASPCWPVLNCGDVWWRVVTRAGG